MQSLDYNEQIHRIISHIYTRVSGVVSGVARIWREEEHKTTWK